MIVYLFIKLKFYRGSKRRDEKERFSEDKPKAFSRITLKIIKTLSLCVITSRVVTVMIVLLLL